MAKSTVTITFLNNPILGNYLTIKNNLAPLVGDIDEYFVNVRQNIHQVQIGETVNVTANNFYNALIFDNGNSGLYDFNISANVVTITSRVSNTQFSIYNLSGSDNIQITIDNQLEQVPIEITGLTFTKDVSNPCGKVFVNVTTNNLAVTYVVNGNQFANNINPFKYSFDRETVHTLIVIDANLTSKTQNIKTPIILAPGNIDVNILNTPNGATITIILFDTFGITPQYSLDNITFKTSNVFTGILPGNYTIYVKDEFGCLVFKDFNVPVFSPDLLTTCPVSYISESMSIRFKHDQVWDYNDIYKTDYNTLSCEEQVMIPLFYKQLFKTSNIVTTQFLSNFQNISVGILREDNSVVNVPFTMLKQFVNLKDRRDATIKPISDQKSGIYYTSGNTYDYNTGVQNGVYSLNGELPDYASIGNYINLNGIGWFIIEDIIHDETVNADMIVITYPTFVPSAAAIVSSNWNQKNYNVFEFKIDFAPHVNEYIQVAILQSSPGFEDFNYLSEVIEVRESFKDHVELIWYNYEDSNVFYSTGIKNIGNFYLNSFKSANDSEVNINKTTNTSIIVEASNYDTKELILDDLPTAIMKQVVQAGLHKAFFVNRIPFVANGGPSVDLIDNTNNHSITLHLTATNPPYLACSPGGSPSPQASYPAPTFPGDSPS